MRRALALLLTASLGLLPNTARADHECHQSGSCDPNPCAGTVGGRHVVHGDSGLGATLGLGTVGVPVLLPGTVIPITNASRGPFYLDVRDVASDHYLDGIWLYQETNGRLALQRGGFAVFPYRDGPIESPDPCDEDESYWSTCDVTKPTCHDVRIW